MNSQLQKDTLVELEFELNRKDILHCRSLITEVPSHNELVVLAPAPVEHGYTFKAGDRIDIYASLLALGDTDHTIHLKATVKRVDKSHHRSFLYLKHSGTASQILNPRFFILHSAQHITLTPESPRNGALGISAVVHAISLRSLRMTAAMHPQNQPFWYASIDVNGTPFTLKGTIEPHDESDFLEHKTVITFHYTDLPAETKKKLALAIEAVHRNYLQSHAELTLHQVFDQSDVQDPLILEHLVPRGWQRITLDILEIFGWTLLILSTFDAVLAAPPDVNFFDRVFLLKPSQNWDTNQLRHIPIFMGIQFFLCSGALGLHRFIYSRGNIGSRWSLWLMTGLSLLLFLSIRSHL